MSIRRSAKRRRSQAFPDQETASYPVETKQQSEEPESVIENALVEKHDTTRDELEPGRISDEMEIDPAVPPENLEKEQEVWDAFREENYEAIEQLPLSLHRSFSLIHELDGQVQAQGTEILSAVRAYIERRRAMIKTVDDTPNTSQMMQEPAPDVVAPNDTSPPRDLPPSSVPSPPIQNSKPSGAVAPIPSASCLEQSTRHMLTTIAQKSEDVVRASSEKVNLARFAYDLVDRYIKELDRAIQDQETSLSLGLRPGTHPASIILPAVVVPMDARGMSRIAHSPAPDVEELLPVDVEMETPTLGIFPTEHQPEEPTPPKQFRRKGRGKPRRKAATAEPVELPVIEPEETPAEPTSGSLKLKLTVPPLTTVATQTQEPPDIVDPNEPRYCYCNQVSYGEMIACDNKECLREWFHLGCVGLAHAPKGKWFCRDCLEPTRKTPRRKAR